MWKSAALTILLSTCGFATAADQCVSGYVWREACPGDFVCVSPAVREESKRENQAGPGRILGNGLCVQGYVWREACGSSDHVCVPPASRTRANADNAEASARVARPPRLIGALPASFTQTSKQGNTHVVQLRGVNLALPTTNGRNFRSDIQLMGRFNGGSWQVITPDSWMTVGAMWSGWSSSSLEVNIGTGYCEKPLPLCANRSGAYEFYAKVRNQPNSNSISVPITITP